MENNKSFAEFMNESTVPQKQSSEMTMMEIYVDMVLNEILVRHRKEKLLKLINEALDNKDQDAFMKYSDELNKLEDTHGV
ncbi:MULTISPECIES: IDEAL domain-containing protein [Jeotgalibacillus]|uniref:IDEAL domain-containing protein n=1 Tax=Jeotgalibacillus TaxID=157226 RepID=UPI00141AA9CC|nr:MULTISPECIES: IDEAL domain-containing protein [Jeotgalibacillus]